MAATGFATSDLQAALNKRIKSKNILVLADACHSGGIGAEYAVARRTMDLDVGIVNQGLQALALAERDKHANLAIITSAGARQLSQESERWGGGHGVFTHFLLEGLEGEADSDEDKKITVSELFPYLSQQVRRATKSAQTPEMSGKAPPWLTLGH